MLTNFIAYIGSFVSVLKVAPINLVYNLQS